MEPSLKAAHEINALWLSCLDESTSLLATCPSDETVAEIIDRNIPQQTTHGGSK